MQNPNPAEFTFIGSYYVGANEDAADAAADDPAGYDFAETHKRHPEAHTVKRSGAESGLSGCCDHCGASHAWGAVFNHEPTGTFIAVGHTCANDVFDLPSKVAKMRRAIEKQVAKATRIRREKWALLPVMAHFMRTNPGLREAFRTDRAIIKDIRGQFMRRGFLSEKQVALVLRIAKQVAEEGPEIQPTKPAPIGRLEVVGTILGIKCIKNDFGSVLKMLVRADDGAWKLWATMPLSLDAERGARISMMVTVTPSDKDQYFAFGKRPTKAKVVA